MIGFQTIVMGLIGDIIASNRKILEDIQYRIKNIEYGKSESSIKEE